MRALHWNAAVPILALVALAQTGCRSRTSEDALLSDQSTGFKTQPIFVLMGGNASCADAKPSFLTGVSGHIAALGTDSMSMQSEFFWLKSEVEKKVKLPWFRSCLRWLDDGRTIVFRTSQMDKDDVTNSKSARGEVIPSDLYDAWLEPVIATLIKLRESLPSAKFYVMGHSYGGWLAMQVAQRLPKDSVGHLATIDPISRANCSPAEFQKSLLRYSDSERQLTKSLSRPLTAKEKEELAIASVATGCAEFPMDVDQKKLVDMVGEQNWRNYYQTNDLFLHSGSTDYPSIQNELIEMPEFRSRIIAHVPGHISIAHKSEVWVGVAQVLMKASGADLVHSEVLVKSLEDAVNKTRDGTGDDLNLVSPVLTPGLGYPNE